MAEAVGHIILAIIFVAVNRIMVKSAYDKGVADAYGNASALLEDGMRKLAEKDSGDRRGGEHG